MVTSRPINVRVKFQNIFEVYSLSKVTFVFWPALNSCSFILVRLGGRMDGLEIEIKANSAPNLSWGWVFSLPVDKIKKLGKIL